MSRAGGKMQSSTSPPVEKNRRRHRLVFFSELFDSLDPELVDRLASDHEEPPPPDECTIQKVQGALNSLMPNEKMVVEEYHFQGRTLRDIALQMSRTRSEVAGLLARGEEKLKTALLPYVAERFGIGAAEPERSCRVCAHPQAAAITQLLLAKPREETWSRVLQQLKARYGLENPSPRTLIAHLRHPRSVP